MYVDACNAGATNGEAIGYLGVWNPSLASRATYVICAELMRNFWAGDLTTHSHWLVPSFM